MITDQIHLKLSDTAMPSDFGVEHDQWRDGQLTALQWIAARTGTLLVAAPTGSGKTMWAKAISQIDGRTVAVMMTKSLQRFNYDQGYGAAPMYGRANYTCAYTGAHADDTAAECHFSPMTDCPDVAVCDYVNARHRARMSNFTAFNYAYYLSAVWARQNVSTLVLDEAHDLSDVVLDRAGVKVNGRIRAKYNLPQLPVITGGSVMTGGTDPTVDALQWLERALLATRIAYRQIKSHSDGSSKANRAIRAAENFGRKLSATLEAIQTNSSDWYIRSNPAEFTARPLTARHHFGSYFTGDADRVLLMSATLGDFSTYAHELGLSSDDFESHRVENIWPTETRPIFDLGVPVIGYKSPPSAYTERARRIAQLIKSCPPDWSAMIHVVSKADATQLANDLASRLGARLWSPKPGTGTDDQIAEWHKVKQRRPNAIAVVWSWGTGVDEGDTEINIVAKVRYSNLGDPFERERFNHNKKFYAWRAATATAQALGRNRRGDPLHYFDLDDQHIPTDYTDTMYRTPPRVVAIADGAYKRVRSYMPQDVIDAFVDWQ